MDLWAIADPCTPRCVRAVATRRIAERIAVGAEDVRAQAAAAGCSRGGLYAAGGLAAAAVRGRTRGCRPG